MRYSITPASGDPSDVIQHFHDIRLNIHCCRYWRLKHWKHQRLSFPFWRLYWNKNSGAYIYYEKEVNLEPSRIILIPPNTPFSTDIRGSENIPDTVNRLEGGWIRQSDDEDELIRQGYILHFFIHFNLGYPFDGITPGIYNTLTNEDQLGVIRQTINVLKSEISDFGIKESLDLNRLILTAVSSLRGDLWKYPSMNKKVFETITYMNRNLRKKLTNSALAAISNMSVNSFARLFRQETGISPQRYLTKIRIEHACSLMHHSNLTINEIADYSGFPDRYYFTKVFNSLMLVSPARYKKQVLLRRG